MVETNEWVATQDDGIQDSDATQQNFQIDFYVPVADVNTKMTDTLANKLMIVHGAPDSNQYAGMTLWVEDWVCVFRMFLPRLG